MRYSYGDIIKIKDTNGSNKMEYYIVIDVFLEFQKDIVSYPLTVDDANTRYTLMQMYPVEKEEYMLFRYTAHTFETVALVGQEQHTKIIELIQRERERQGKTDEPFYIETIRKRERADAFDKYIAKHPDTTKHPKQKGKKKKIKITDDVIQYDKLMSVDECLDAMNDLTNLHKTFGDESYLQLREVVVGRLKDLTDIIKKAKSWDASTKK